MILTMNHDEWFKNAYAKYSEKVFGFVNKMLNSDIAAADIVSETFIRLYKKGPEVDGYLIQWLYRVSRNLTYQYIQDNVRYTILSEDDYKNELFEDAPPIDKIRLRENIADMFKCIDRLNEKHKKVIELRYFKNLPYKDISDIMKETEGNVGFMLNAAIKKLKVYMDECIEKN
jgi:RNA polymerase sigma factor (sigma-70 family)